ncbi:putative F-box protein At5g41500 isoform X2 [Apium graveolens]
MVRDLQLSVREETSISDLPQDVLGLILSRLPARSLLSCQCVCKHFNAVSRNPIVLANHVKRASTSNTTTFCSVLHHGSDEIIDRYDHVLLENTDDSVSLSHVRPSNPVSSNISIVDSCNGLFCAEIETPGAENGGCFLIWNPLTRENRFVKKRNVNTLRAPDNHAVALRNPYTFAIAFGFTHKTNDYKLVRIVSYFGFDYPSTVEVYNMTTEKWSSYDITTLPCLEPDKVPPYFNSPSILYSISYAYFTQPLKRAFHWLADSAGIEDRLSKAVVSFDLEEEQLNLFTWLDPFKIPLVELAILDSLNDKLSLIVPCIDCPNPSFDIWVMTEYGYQDSWTRQLTVEQFDGLAMPVGYWKDDLFIMAKFTMGERFMFFYNLITQEVKILPLLRNLKYSAFCDYVETLETVN